MNRHKRKEQLLNQYNQRDLEVEWAKYKYWVMSRSQKTYNDLRTLFKDNENVNAYDFYELIEVAERLSGTIKSEVNAFEHVWGYFKNIASEVEKNEFLKTMDYYRNEAMHKSKVYKLLFNMAEKYDVKYLLDSYYFDDYQEDA